MGLIGILVLDNKLSTKCPVYFLLQGWECVGVSDCEGSREAA